eukprot:17578-Heterococcus_DN1.PRE.7
MVAIVAQFYAVIVPALAIDPVDSNVDAHARGLPADGSSQEKTFCFLCQLYVHKSICSLALPQSNTCNSGTAINTSLRALYLCVQGAQYNLLKSIVPRRRHNICSIISLKHAKYTLPPHLYYYKSA